MKKIMVAMAAFALLAVVVPQAEARDQHRRSNYRGHQISPYSGGHRHVVRTHRYRRAYRPAYYNSYYSSGYYPSSYYGGYSPNYGGYSPYYGGYSPFYGGSGFAISFGGGGHYYGGHHGGHH